MAVGGSAGKRVANKVIATGRALAAELLQAKPEDVGYADGRFPLQGSNHSLGLADVARHSQSKDPVGLSESAEFKPSAVTFPNGCHMVEVEIDPQTGVVKIDARLCLGIRHIEMSATPARVWAVIQGAKLAVPRPKSMSNASRIRSSELRPIATAALVPLLVAHGALYGVDVGTATGALHQWRTAQVCLEQVDRANTRWRPSASQRLHPRRAVRPIAQTSARSGSLAKPPPSRSHAWSLTVIDGCMRLCEPAIPVGMAS